MIATHQNQIYEVSNSIQEVTYTTDRTGSPGKLEFTILKTGNISFFEGDVVRFSVDGELVFYGWIFTKSKDRWGVITVTCYDRLRYLKASASYAFYGQTAGDIIKQIAADFKLDVSEIEDTGYKIPSLIEEEQTCLDIIADAIQQTLLNTGKIYICFDNGKGICLKEAANLKTDVVLGDGSLVTEYTYKTDIDEQTYNSVKLVQANEDTGKADVYIAQDSNNIKRWGLLQLYQKVDDNMNAAQIKSRAVTELKYYNRRMRTLSVESLGVPGLRAGSLVYMDIATLGDIHLKQYVLLEKVTHTFSNDTHTMSFDTMAI